MPTRFTDRIIQHLAHAGYEPSKAATIARDMQVRDEDRTEFDEAIRLLTEDKRLSVSSDGVVRLPRFGKEVVGTLRVNVRGFGFVRPERTYMEGDLFIPPDGMRDAISGDRVRAAVMRRDSRRGKDGREARTYGRVLEVVERGQEHFVGVLLKERGQWFVQPDGKALFEPVVIRDPHARNAKAGDKVVIELLHYPDEGYLPEGVITRVLGEAGRPDVETAAVIAGHGLRTEFEGDVLAEARAAVREFDSETEADWADREDLTGVFTFTIDPPDAKDFDDAISVSFDADTRLWTLGVHIADVTHFVKHGSAADKEARTRGNSVYLPRHVIPMLPEVLSNGVCSLQDGVHRLTKSAFMTFDEKGNVKSQRLASTVIKSRKRLTYLEAQALIDGEPKEAEKHAKTAPEYSDELVTQLRDADKLARILRKRRLRDGQIVLSLPQVELVFDDDGHVIDAVPEDDAFTHTVIEMCMVEANEAVARTFSELMVPLLRRIHPDPVHGDLEELRMYARAAKFKLPESPTKHDLQRLLDATRHGPAHRAIHLSVLRTLTKATYSPALVGHYGLGSEHYAHFTSPIRRYPDLHVHRVIGAFLDATSNGTKPPRKTQREKLARRLRDDPRVPDEGALIELGNHCSETETEAEAAENELRTFLVMQFLHDNHLGAEFTGVVTGVINRGVFVSIERFLVEGLVLAEDLLAETGKKQEGSGRGGGDRWTVSENSGRLVSRKTGLSFGIGDIVTARIVAVDVGARRLDLVITDMPVAIPAGDDVEGALPGKDARKSRGKAKSKKGKKGKGHSRSRSRR